MLNMLTRSRLLSYLKVVSCSEGEWGPGGLLGAPALGQEGVSDEDSFLQTRVKMKSDVAAAGHSQVDAETETHKDTKFDGSEAPPTSVSDTQVSDVFVPVCVLIGLSSDCDAASNTQSSHQLTSEGDALQDTRDTETQIS